MTTAHLVNSADESLVVTTLIAARKAGKFRTEARREAFAALHLDISQHGLREEDTVFIDSMLHAVYEPHGCSVCGAHDLYVGNEHRCT